MKKILMVLLATFIVQSVPATALSDLAVSMKPGAWAVLNTNGLNSALVTYGCNGVSILGYSDGAMWDPIGRKFYHMGSPHCGGAAGCHAKLIEYDEAANAWTDCGGLTNACPHSSTDCSHAYDLSTIDPATRTWYRRMVGPTTGPNRVSGYNFGTNGPWVDIAPVDIGYGTYGAMAWFPELYGRGGLVTAQGGYGEVHCWNKATNRWTKIGNNLPMGGYQQFVEYSPAHRVVLCGGGGTPDFYKVDSAAGITKMPDAPCALGVGSSVTTVDPVSGDYLVLSKDGRFYQYDVLSDAWTILPASPITSYDGHWVIATPVSNYGVVMFLHATSGQQTVYLYKHAHAAGSMEAENPFAGNIALQASPNPFQGSTILSFPSIHGERTLCDLRGKVIQKFTGSRKNFTWDTGELPAGIYVMRLITPSRSHHLRLIKL